MREIDEVGREPNPDPVGAAVDDQPIGGRRLRIERERPDPLAGRPLRRQDDRLGRGAGKLDPPEEVVPRSHRDRIDGRGEERSLAALHPIEDPQDLVGKVLVATATVFDVGGVEALGEVAIEIHAIAGKGAVVEFAPHDVDRQRAGVVPVVVDVAAGAGRDRYQPRPQIGMGQSDVPGGVAAEGVAREEDPVCVDRESPLRLPQGAEDGRVLAGGIAVGRLPLLRPAGRDDDAAVAGRLADPTAIGPGRACPPGDLVCRRREGGMERDHRRIAAEGIVLRRHLDEARDRLPVGACEFKLVEPRGRRLRGIERRAHLSRQARDGRRVTRLLVGHQVP